MGGRLTMSSGSSGQRVTVPEPLSSTLFFIKRISRVVKEVLKKFVGISIAMFLRLLLPKATEVE